MSELNNEQLQAVNSKSDRILCLAGAGAGKTKTMIDRIMHLVDEGIPPSSIMALTFTNAAAAEMKERYSHLNIGKEIPEFRTFHSFCYSIVCRDNNIREALGYSEIPAIASEEQEKEIELKAKVQCNITLSKEQLKERSHLSKKEQFQVDLYDKAVSRLMRSANLITFDKLNSEVSDLFASDHPSTRPYKQQYKYIFADECLPASMSVLTDDGWYRIDKLYKNYNAGKTLPLVKSYNIKTLEFEYKPIIGALRSENREVFEIHTEGLNKIRCTSNHKIYTQRGYVEAKDLIVGQDMVILDQPDKQKTKYLLNSDQYQICLGSYLGDGHISYESKFYTYRLQFTQGLKQRDYFLSKIAAFNLKYRTIKSGYTGKSTILSTSPTPVFALKDDIYNCVLSDISSLGLAIWYQDDGTLYHGKYARICTGSFSEEQDSLLVNMLKTKFDIEAKFHIDKKGYSYITFNAKSNIKFFELISPYMHPSMQYKTPIDISNNIINYNSNYQNIGANFIDKITYIGVDTVYDLTIADNHNFIVSSNSHRTDNKTGTIVHNCQDTDRYQMQFLNSFTDTNFYFCGDCLQNIYSFRGTSNEYIKALANAEGWEKIRLYTNYRSTSQICEYANKFSQSYADQSYRIEMKGIREGNKVSVKLVDGPSRYSAIDTRDIDNVLKEIDTLEGTSAILCRTNKEVAAVGAYLKSKNIKYTSNRDNYIQQILDCATSDTYMLGLLASYLSSDKYGEYIRLSTLAQNVDLAWFIANYGKVPQIQSLYKQVVALKNISIQYGTISDKLAEVATILHLESIPVPDTDYFGDDFLSYLKDTITKIKSSELYVGTIHSVKGLEYDNIFVMNVGSYSFKLNTEDMRNLFYVAITRAKNNLFIYQLFDC